MVSGLLVPTVAAIFGFRGDGRAAMWSVILGGGRTLLLLALDTPSPSASSRGAYGLLISLGAFSIAGRSSPWRDASAPGSGRGAA